MSERPPGAHVPNGLPAPIETPAPTEPRAHADAPESAPATRTFRMTVEYDGTDFFGWQVQPGRRTVQGEIEDAIAAATGERVRVTGAGRTDRGVHALGQVASFDSATALDGPTIGRALNARLARDATVRGVTEAPRGWSARRNAISRLYAYRIVRRRAPMSRRDAWEMWARLDIESMRAASERLIGARDMIAFATSPPEGKSGEVNLMRVVWREEPGLLIAEFEADRFLRGMVRTMVGTLIEVGRGRRAPEDVDRVIASRDRSQAGPTAPARGLCLVAVRYPGDPRSGSAAAPAPAAGIRG